MNTTSPAPLSFFQNELKGFVYKRVKDKALTDDIIQDVFLKVQSKSDQLNDKDKLVGWIYQIARNAIADYFREKSKVIRPADIDWGNDYSTMNDCVTQCLQATLITLPEKYREALSLAELESVPQHELAKRLNISYSGAKSRVQRARQLLREKMDKQFRIETDTYGNVVACENLIPCSCSKEFAEACD